MSSFVPLVTRADGIFSSAAQCHLEDRAVEIFREESIQKVMDHVYDLALTEPQALLQAGATSLKDAMNELIFAFIIRNLNSDSLNPYILWDQNPPHILNDQEIPGSRCTGNNPDNIYRRIPVDPAERYILRGQPSGPVAPDITFSVLPSMAKQEGWQPTLLSLADVRVDDSGNFEIEIDGDERGNRNNHIYLDTGANRLTIRESLADWGRDSPLALEIFRKNKTAPFRLNKLNETDYSLVEHIVAFAKHWLDFNNRTYYRSKANLLPPVKTPPGGLASQQSVMGNYSLESDDALVIRADASGASYFSFSVMDPWMRCVEYRMRTASLTGEQAVSDADGKHTVVLSLEDPGVKNWLDPGGFAQGALQLRWQGIPNGRIDKEPFVELRQSKLIELKSILPEDTLWVSKEERIEQCKKRREFHDRRFQNEKILPSRSVNG